MDPRLLFPILFIGVLLFWASVYWVIAKIIDYVERKHADHHRR